METTVFISPFHLCSGWALSPVPGASLPLNPGWKVRVSGNGMARHLHRGQGSDLQTLGQGCQATAFCWNGSLTLLGQVRRITPPPRHASKHSKVTCTSGQETCCKLVLFGSSIVLGFLPTSHLRCHSLLHVVKKSTREVKAFVRERVLPWYKEEGREMGKTSFFRCTHGITTQN